MLYSREIKHKGKSKQLKSPEGVPWRVQWWHRLDSQAQPFVSITWGMTRLTGKGVSSFGTTSKKLLPSLLPATSPNPCLLPNHRGALQWLGLELD